MERNNFAEQKGFRNLQTWQKAYDLALHIYKTVKYFPDQEEYVLCSQIRRASISVIANIAEGYERQTPKEFARFLRMAKGSLGEIETYLLFSKDLGYIKSELYDILENKRQDTSKLLRGLINYLHK